MNCKPYIDILKELGYFIIEEDIDTTYDSKDPYKLEDCDYYINYYPIFAHSNKRNRISLELVAEGYKDVKNYFKTGEDYTKLNLNKIKAYYTRGDCLDERDDCDSLVFFNVSTRFDDIGIADIKRITPDIFRIILKITESEKSEFEHSNKILQRYLDAYFNIIVPIVNPVAQLKKLIWNSPSLEYGFNSSYNRNIEIDYRNNYDEIQFTVGIDYVTGNLYFYPFSNTNSVMENFEFSVTTKGRLLELLKSYGI